MNPIRCWVVDDDAAIRTVLAGSIIGGAGGAATGAPLTVQLKTSQLAWPLATTQGVSHRQRLQRQHGPLAAIGLSSDNVFSDGIGTQLAAVTGDGIGGYVATLRVGIAA